jgi:hypothetical protein
MQEAPTKVRAVRKTIDDYQPRILRFIKEAPVKTRAVNMRKILLPLQVNNFLASKIGN